MEIKLPSKKPVDFATEIRNIAIGYRRLLDDQYAKIPNFCENDKRALQWYIILFICFICGICAFKPPFFLFFLPVIFPGFRIVLYICAVRRNSKFIQSIVNSPSYVCRLDESGVSLEYTDGRPATIIAWENMLCVRIFEKTVCFFSDGLTINISEIHKDDVLRYIREHGITVNVILREAAKKDYEQIRHDINNQNYELNTDYETNAQTIKRIPYVTIFLIIINVAVFVYCAYFCIPDEFEIIKAKGALYEPAVIAHSEYHRYITSMFLHLDVSHLTSNMMALIFTGIILEPEIGHIRFGIIYTLSGIFSGFATIVWLWISGNTNNTFALGASGAIMGLMGAMLVLLIRGNKGVNNKRILWYIMCMAIDIGIGFFSPGIDNAGHIGGFVTGIIVAIVITLKNQYLM